MDETLAPRAGTLRHEALFYTCRREYVKATVSFVREGLAAGEPVMLAVPGAKVELLRASLGQSAREVRFLDMTRLGRNPSRIIPAIQEFLDEHPAAHPYFVGEPVWAGRTPSEVLEATRHEALINLAFADRAASILCPYDMGALDARTVDDATRTHPEILDADGRRRSAAYTDPDVLCNGRLFPLPPLPPDNLCIEFAAEQLASVRLLVEREAIRAGLTGDQIDDLVVAVNEVATNTLVHTPGVGTLCIWREPESVVCEVTDQGYIADPLAGRHRPTTDITDGRGLWLANRLCDLVAIRSGPTGTTVRLCISRHDDETGDRADVPPGGIEDDP